MSNSTMSKTETDLSYDLLDAMARGAIVAVEAQVERNTVCFIGRVHEIKKSMGQRDGLSIAISFDDTNAMASIELSDIVTLSVMN